MAQQVKVFVTRLEDPSQNLVTHMTGRTDPLKWSSELRTRTVAHNNKSSYYTVHCSQITVFCCPLVDTD